MKTMLKVLSLAALLAASAPLALADAINVAVGVNGTASSLNSTEITLLSPGNLGAVSADQLITPSSAGFFSACTGCVTFNTTELDYGANNVTTTLSAFETSGGLFIGSVTQGGETLSFWATNETPVWDPATGLHITGTGYFTETGVTDYDPTAATYIFNASTTGQVSTFQATSGTNSPVPEPSSLMLLGTGLLTAVGVARRKFNA